MALLPSIVSHIFIQLPINLLLSFFSLFIFITCTIFNRRYPPSLSFLTLPATVKREGFDLETHNVVTDDGYCLTCFRIPTDGSNNTPTTKDRPIVVLWHGLLDSAYTFLFNGRSNGLAYHLASQGFDVWMPNNRGNIYSRHHLYLNEHDNDYWAFSYDEFAMYDVPAVIKYIKTATNNQNNQNFKVAYVGHSEGTTQFFGALAIDPSLSSSISCFVGLGPVVSVGHIKNYLLLIAAKLHFFNILYYFGYRKSFFITNGWSRWMIGAIVEMFPFLGNEIISLLCGKSSNPHNITHKNAADWGLHEPGGTSLQNINHWLQNVSDKTVQFKFYDYNDPLINLKKYGQLKPPHYNYSNVEKKIPKKLYVGLNDKLVDFDDVNILISQLVDKKFQSTSKNPQDTNDSTDKSKKEIHYNNEDPNLIVETLPTYCHTDYIWSSNAPVVLYPWITQFLNQHASKNKC